LSASISGFPARRSDGKSGPQKSLAQNFGPRWIVDATAGGQGE
jgi:hypothetical protein